MEVDGDAGSKRGRGRGRRGRGRGRGGRGRGKRSVIVISSDEDASLEQLAEAGGIGEDADVSGAGSGGGGVGLDQSGEDVTMQDLDKEPVASGQHLTPIATTLSAPDPLIPLPLLRPVVTTPVAPAPTLPPTIDMEADISQLEAPTFTTISRGPPEPMLRLTWDHKVSLIGEKVLNPMIHCCDQCDKPILLYGRMIPCKHVFCLKCARTEPVKICPRCNDKVVRVEQSGLGTVFMCTHGGSLYGNTGCRRTYLSQRDLQAHINHRHVTQPQPPMTTSAGLSGSDLKADMLSLGSALQRTVTAAALPMQQPSASNLRGGNMRGPATGMMMGSGGVGGAGVPGMASSNAPSGGGGGGGGVGGGPHSHSHAHAHAHSTLTQANLARINSANEQHHQVLHQTLKKVGMAQSTATSASSHHQPPEAVADASYYSSVLNSPLAMDLLQRQRQSGMHHLDANK